ncbi:MAG: FtsX-like permease family protein [Liquorilactobacillus ghanensis]|uniref:ABC transporter permease n=1 Tax=Liquorilactobacillus ghanensis TaxID=399370 RepID=UPI0039EB68D8
MKFLIRKLMRTIVKNWVQFFSVLLMVFLSVLFYTGLEGTWHGMSQSINQYVRSSNLATAWIQTTGITNHEFKRIQKLPLVSLASKSSEISTKARLNNQTRYVNLATATDNKLSRPDLIGSKKINSRTTGVYLNKEFADANHLKKGDTLKFHYQNKTIVLPVIGMIRSPEKMYYTGSSDYLSPQKQNYGYGIVSSQTLAHKFGYKGLPTKVTLKSKKNFEVESQVRQILGAKYITMSTRKSDPEIATAISRVSQIKDLSVLFATIFILLSILAMYTTIKRLIDSQQRDIAVLRALGYSKRALLFYYSLYGLSIGIVGTLLGWLGSPILSNFVLASQKQMFSLPNWQVCYTLNSIWIALLVIIICTFSAMWASRGQSGQSPAEALKGKPGKKSQKVFLETWKRLWNKLSIGRRWAWRDSLGDPVRLVMGIVGVVGGLALIMTGFGTKDSMSYQVKNTFGHEFTYNRQLDLNEQNTDKLNQQLVHKTKGQALSVISASVNPRGKFDRPLTVIDRGQYVHLTTTTGKKIHNGGIYVTQGLANTMKVKPGDYIRVTPSLTTKAKKIVVKEILRSSATQGLYLTRLTWDQWKLRFRPNEILIGKKKISHRILTSPAISKVVSISDQRNNAQKMVDNLSSIFLLIQVFGIILAVVILYNLGSLSFTERSRNYATFRILGFQKSEIRSLTTSENLSTTILGLCIGVPFGFWFLAKYVTTFSTDQIIYYPVLNPFGLVAAILITTISSLSTILLVGRRLRELNMIAATKGVE